MLRLYRIGIKIFNDVATRCEAQFFLIAAEEIRVTATKAGVGS